MLTVTQEKTSLAAQEGLHAEVAVPIRYDGQVIGAWRSAQHAEDRARAVLAAFHDGDAHD